ncbi:serine/threonine protein kinase [Corallococcus praedator]|uniref:non-specific serine/threonine protein kinase n=1 Tax=Corallococcus praedator TaxID=2316724 RepID=A0ABX9Q4V9_9BACT|nr:MULTISPECIES: serine/threonine-protein kinase [Corallococcus]RKH26607.1 serine/threonine protein kinase [Corallococcus sp. CA031C]RKH90736.1 serine/threonine protein kinase [Corallococcus praedator]
MTTPLHPDQLEVGHHVGPWRIVGSLGAGGFGRVFKVERGGHVYALKIALRPAGPHAAEEEDVNGRLSREVAALLACAPHPNLPRVHAVDRWPAPPDGYFFHVTDYVDGETFHEWRWRVKPSAAHLLTVYTEVVRVVADLHRRGVHHRDLKADNLLIRRVDERPVLIDLGTARIPGASTLTVGVAPASPHLLPPECVAFLREGSWKAGANFDAGVPGDLYALGALLYESLTDGYAFDPRLPYDRLLPAIETVVPRAPHEVNPKVPQALGDIAMRLLSKRPEDRYSSTETLLQALWEAAKDKRQQEWKLSLDVPMDREAPLVDRGVVSLSQFPGTAQVPEPVPERVATLAPSIGLSPSADSPVPGEGAPPSSGARRHRIAGSLGLGVLLLGLLVFGLFRSVPSTRRPAVPPDSEKGSSSVTPTPSLPDASVLAVASAPDAGASPEEAPSAPVQDAEGVAATPTPVKPLRTDGGMLRKIAGAATAACVGASCGGGTGRIRSEGDTLDPCPKGAARAMRELQIPPAGLMAFAAPAGNDELMLVPVTAGWRSMRIDPNGQWGGGRARSVKVKVIFGKERTRFLVTEVTQLDGQILPICMDYLSYMDHMPGWAPLTGRVAEVNPRDTATVRYIPNLMNFVPVQSFVNVEEG